MKFKSTGLLGEGLKGNRLRNTGKVWKKIILWGAVGFILLSQPIYARAESSGITSVYDDGIPINVRIYCEVIGNQFNICPEVLESMAYQESRFKVDAANGPYKGLMQVNVNIHSERIAKYGYTPEDMTTSAYANILIAGDYLAELYALYGDENPIVLSVYSGNWKAVEDYKEYGFLTPYVDEVLTRSASYERKHQK